MFEGAPYYPDGYRVGMSYHNFALQPGYAEDTCLCEMSVSHDGGFETIEGAIENLRLTIIAYLTSTTRIRPCCSTSMSNQEFRYCPRCGSNLEGMRAPDAGNIQGFFLRLPMTTVDEGADMLRFFEERGWHLDGFYNFPDEAPCSVRAVTRWMGRDDTDDFPYMEGTYPNGETYCSFREDR